MSQSDLLVISSSRGVLETLLCRTDLDSPGDRRYWLVSCPLDVGSLTGCNHIHLRRLHGKHFLNVCYIQIRIYGRNNLLQHSAKLQMTRTITELHNTQFPANAMPRNLNSLVTPVSVTQLNLSCIKNNYQ